MKFVGASSRPRVFATQVGNPLAYRHEDFANGIRADRLATAAGPAAVAEPEDDEVEDALLGVPEVTKGREPSLRFAKVHPPAEGDVFGAPGFAGSRLGGELQRSAEVSAEAAAGGRCSIRHGRGCG